MTSEENFEWLNQTKKEKSYSSDKAAPFSDYLENPEGKFVVAITKSQYVFYAKSRGDHAFMAVDIIKEIRPDLKMDAWGNSYDPDENFREHNVLIFGYPRYSLVSLPSKEMLSPNQYKELEKILLGVKEYNQNNPHNVWELFVEAPEETNIESGYYQTKIDELLTSLGNYVTDDYKTPNEKIIGKAISKDRELYNPFNWVLFCGK